MSIDILDWKMKPRFFSGVIWHNNVRVYINIAIWNCNMFWVKRMCTVLFGLTDNLLKTIQENIFNAQFNYRKNISYFSER